MVPHAEKQTQYIIQYLRAVAAFMVVFHHAAFQVAAAAKAPFFLGTNQKITEIGAAGVDVFFVISGFIIFYTMTNAVGGKRSISFLWHRFVRVVPLYWFWTSILIVAIVARVALAQTQLDPIWVAASYALIPYEHVSGRFHPILDQGWTLSFEIYFYAITAISIWFLPMRFRLAGLAIALLTVQVICWLASPPPAIEEWLGSPLVYEFLAGALVACIFRFGFVKHTFKHRHIVGALVAAIGIAAFLGSMLIDDSIENRAVFWGVPGTLIVFGAVLLNRPPSTGIERILLVLGSASYSLYLTHTLFTITLGGLLKRGYFQAFDPNLMIIGATILITLVGSSTYFVVERPLLSIFRRKQAPPYVAEPAVSA